MMMISDSTSAVNCWTVGWDMYFYTNDCSCTSYEVAIATKTVQLYWHTLNYTVLQISSYRA